MAETSSFTVLAELAAAMARLEPAIADRLAAEIAAAPRVFVHGIGRSGRVLGVVAVKLAQLGLPVHLVGESATPAAAPGDLLLVASGSGKTAGTLVVAERASGLGVRVVALTATPDTPLASLARPLLVLPGTAKDGSGIASVQPPGSLFEQVLFCLLEEVVLCLARQHDPGFVGIRSRHANLE